MLDQRLLKTLRQINGTGNFASTGAFPFFLPGMSVAEVGKVSFPLGEHQAQALIAQAKQAPFGKGSETITDTSVRRTWEVDASQIEISNPQWHDKVASTLQNIKKDLALEGKEIKAELYKLLIYEKGSFFLPHRDSEKADGMFATLVILLPSPHTGGELVIRFDGREQVFRSADTEPFHCSYVAFYADCQHEVREVTSGYRIGLVYNLILDNPTDKTARPLQTQPQVEALAQLLNEMAPSFSGRPKALLLDHQYTPANFSPGQLKGDDRVRVPILMEAAEKAGYYTKLGLVTHHQSGEWENAGYNEDYYYRRRRRYDDYDDEEEKEEEETIMGEIFEEYTTVEHWSEDEQPSLGQLNISEHDLITNYEIGQGRPIELEKEGWTGNAGMTLDYWYHYGAVFLWPKAQQAQLVAGLNLNAQMQWLKYYNKNYYRSRKDAEATAVVNRILEGLLDYQELYPRHADFDPAVDALAKFDGTGLSRDLQQRLAVFLFPLASDKPWPDFTKCFGQPLMGEICQEVAAAKNLFFVYRLLDAWHRLEFMKYTDLVASQMAQLPEYLSGIDLHKTDSEYDDEDAEYYDRDHYRGDCVSEILSYTLIMAHYHDGNPDWIEGICDACFANLNRTYFKTYLALGTLNSLKNSQPLGIAILKRCVEVLRTYTAQKPQPPADWTFSVPKSTYYAEVWTLLEDFLASPEQRTFDYTANQNDRSTMESAIRNAKVDLDAETIKKGRPYTLRLTKTHATYERELKIWENDMAVLNEILYFLDTGERSNYNLR